MKLLGSLASPYVRRIRLQLIDREYEFEKINIFEDADRKRVSDLSPTIRIPILIDGDQVIWDSLLISQYLNAEPIPLDVQKELVLVNEMSDAGIQLFQLRKFGTDQNDQSEFSKTNLRRIASILDYFSTKPLNSWDLPEKWLFCTLDWFKYRNVYKWEDSYKTLKKFYESHLNRPEIIATDPRAT